MLRSTEAKTVILGAGPAGMAAAMELWKKKHPTVIIEKNTQVGGLARTLEFKEGNDVFRTDIGPHRFFSKNQYLYDFIGDLLGEEWITVNRLTRFFIRGRLYSYPIEWKNALKNLGISKSIHLLLDYMWERLKDVVYGKRVPRNFEEYTVRTFGRTLAELNMLNYTEKIWGLPCSELSVDWADRIKGLSFWAAIKNTVLKRSHDSPKTLVDQFYYPEFGAGMVYEKIRERISLDIPFLFSSQPTHIRHDAKRVTSVTITTPSGEVEIAPETVVTSIPIVDLLPLLQPLPPPEILAHAKALRHRSQVYLFITVNKKQIFPDQWIYLPDSHVPFGRVSEMKNFSSKMAPKNATSLFIEFFCWEGDRVWEADAETLLTMCLPFFEKWKWLTREDIRKSYIHRQSKVYPVYDLEYRGHIDAIKKYVDSFSNLYSIGRPGRFKYNNQDHSLEMGIMAATGIINHTAVDFDAVMSGKEYMESGAAPLKKK
ncbi:MAG: NAD(P)-binding protein [Candidatus Andersenbacteria bacterium]|nr:NAD(P)-binding protein [Candidatus Andersenbacteria bacterium]MBI3250245.1 NAD(P)-binding protein [Candidatus Andersenbacteria bacterium]